METPSRILTITNNYDHDDEDLSTEKILTKIHIMVFRYTKMEYYEKEDLSLLRKKYYLLSRIKTIIKIQKTYCYFSSVCVFKKCVFVQQKLDSVLFWFASQGTTITSQHQWDKSRRNGMDWSTLMVWKLHLVQSQVSSQRNCDGREQSKWITLSQCWRWNGIKGKKKHQLAINWVPR